MTTTINNVINISLAQLAQLAQADNMNLCTVVTGEQGILTSAERYRSYSSLPAVEADWGSLHEMTAHATRFFGQSPNPINADGRFIASYYRAASENVAATAGTLFGADLTIESVVAALQLISDGSMVYDVDGANKVLTGLDFQAVTDLAGIQAVVNAAVVTATGATCAVNDSGLGLDIISATTGVLSTMTIVTAHTSGSFVGDILKLASGTGATLVQGVAAAVLGVETPVAGLTAIKTAINFKGVTFAKPQSAANRKLIATWAQANDTLVYIPFSDPDELNKDPLETPWAIKLASEKNARMLFRKDGDQIHATGYMARMHVINFNAENSALTMHLKEIIGSVAEVFSQTELDNAKDVGLDTYTSIKKSPVTMTSGANGYTDTQYIQLGFVEQVAVDMFNTLKATPTKIAQTLRGVNTMLTTAQGTTRRFVRANAFGPGTWQGAVPFGDEQTFRESIIANGFYWLAGQLADQSAADRSARKSPVFQGAVKFTGAFHSIQVIINVNE